MAAPSKVIKKPRVITEDDRAFVDNVVKTINTDTTISIQDKEYLLESINKEWLEGIMDTAIKASNSIRSENVLRNSLEEDRTVTYEEYNNLCEVLSDKIELDKEECEDMDKFQYRKSLLLEADEIVNSRQAVYGNLGESFNEVARLANLLFTSEERSNCLMTAQKIVKVMIAIKQIRDKHSPDNPDHIRDCAGYYNILDKLRQEEEAS